jgi:hypothetical protein
MTVVLFGAVFGCGMKTVPSPEDRSLQVTFTQGDGVKKYPSHHARCTRV